ncbi:MAG: hypothetical protein PHR35_13790 [Kiritimatiellae bacterium]|nr:hypothetical protein [Kiritimatiellia bacterium]
MKRGFTLLELLISSALLLAILSILATIIARANSLRDEGTRRTALLTQGRAALDVIADDLQNTIATNLEVLSGAEIVTASYGSTNNGLWLLRATSAPRDPRPGATTNPPMRDVFYRVSASRSGGYGLFRGSTHYDASANPTGTNAGYVVTRRWNADGIPYPVTNVVSGFGTTIIPAAQSGETIMLPVEAYSATRIYDWVASTRAWLDVTATDSPLTNRVTATVIVSNGFERLSVITNALANAPAGFWPTVAHTTVTTGFQAASFLNVAAESFGYALFTNTPAVAVTNIGDEVGRTTFSSAWLVLHWSDGQEPQPTNSFTGAEIAWTNLPSAVVEQAWSIPSDTNLQAGVRGESWWYDWSAGDTTVRPLAGLTNMPWQGFAVTNVQFFPPASLDASAATNLPLTFVSTNGFSGSTGPFGFELTNTVSAVALAFGQTLAPMQTQAYWRAIETVATSRTTPSNHVVTLWQHINQVATNILETFVPAALWPAGYYPYGDQVATRDWVDTIRYVDTLWTPQTLIEDYEGGPTEIMSLWLEPGDRTARGYTDDSNAVVSFVGQPAGPVANTEEEMLDGIAALYFQPLCFRRPTQDGAWQLAQWAPGDAEPPVCVDVYLEMIDPYHARRAAVMGDPDQAKEFVARHALRLTRRVALRPHNRWGEP